MDTLETLQQIEADYPTQPPVVQREDLKTINRLRAELGMPPFDTPPKATPRRVPVRAEPPQPDLTRAAALYAEWLPRYAVLTKHRAYANAVCRATAGPGMTPVRPLATMGTGGGPLLCDHCRKPIVLEGGRFNGVNADVAWARRGTLGDNWKSYISGGVVFEIVDNGTLRVYHGYPGPNMEYCCNARTVVESQSLPIPTGLREELAVFLEGQMSDATPQMRTAVMREILEVMFHTEVGFGVNVPD